jgi:hypothetical protein
MPTPENPQARLPANGYLKWAGDQTGRLCLTPDGLRLVTVAEALAEIDANEKKAEVTP